VVLTDEVATEQLRSWTAEIIECKNCAADKKHVLENGEPTVDIDQEKQREEARKSVDIVEAAQA
jgi:hypothetical protein